MELSRFRLPTALAAMLVGTCGEWHTIRALRASYTNEVLTFIHVHWAFIKPNPDSCADMYDGPYANNGFLERSNTSADQIKDSNYGQGGQHTWTNAGAHQWKDDGVASSAGSSGATDICKDFGF